MRLASKIRKVLLASILSFITVSCGSDNVDENAELKFFGPNANAIVESIGEAAIATPLLGKIEEAGSPYDGDRCQIALTYGENARWRNGAPHFAILNLDFLVHDYVNGGKKPHSYRASNNDRLHYKKLSQGSRIRVWTKSGLVLTAKTGYTDLNFDREGRLISASYGGYENWRDVPHGLCLLDTPFAF